MNASQFDASLRVAWPVLCAVTALQVLRIVRWLRRQRMDTHHPEADQVVRIERANQPLRFWWIVISNSIMALLMLALVIHLSARWFRLIF